MQRQAVNSETIANWLATSSACQGLMAEDLADIAERMEVRTFPENERLAEAGEDVREFWILVDGYIESFYVDLHGREQVFGIAGPGDTLGEVPLIEKTLRPLRLVAQSAGKLLVLPAADFHELVGRYPVLMRNLFRKLSIRLKEVVGIERHRLPSPRVMIIAESPRSRVLAGRLVARLNAAGERLRVWADNPRAIRDANPWPPSQPLHDLSHGEPAFLQAPMPDVDRRILICAPHGGNGFDFRQAAHCDEILWFVEPQDAELTFLRIGDSIQRNKHLKQNSRIVWILGNGVSVAPGFPAPTLARADIKVHVETAEGPLSRLETQGLDRLFRVFRGYSLGIALAGGGAKGMAHLGVLRALEEAGISFDFMSGTSAGAMAGILYAAGMPADIAAESFQRDLTPSRLFRMLPNWPNLYLLTQFRQRAWEAMLRPYLQDWRLEQLPISFAALTVDLIQGHAVVRRTGDAVHAILESINLPVVSRPILRDGMMLVDGGALNNLPADILSSDGADFVVGVDVARRMRHEFAGNRADSPVDTMENAGVLETLFRIFEVQAHNLGAIRNRVVDFWITPDTSSFAMADFYRTGEIAAVGEAAAQEILSELKQRLGDLEARLFNPATVRE
jgi:predicted acylesterase/phospholipase RssA/CRP-like cAMP-binding protein